MTIQRIFIVKRVKRYESLIIQIIYYLMNLYYLIIIKINILICSFYEETVLLSYNLHSIDAEMIFTIWKLPNGDIAIKLF